MRIDGLRSLRFLILVALAGLLPAQQVVTWGSTRRTVRYEYRLMNPTSEVATKIDVYVPLPLESPRQEIHYVHYPERGLQRVFTDVHGQKLIHYSFDRLEAGEWVDLGFVVGITLRNLRWDLSAGISPELTPEQRQRYLTAEADYSMESPLMRETAAELTRGITSDYEKLARIHDHIIRRIRYVRDSKWDPAAEVLARGTGSCSEYNYVLSGLCRLAGLPTRCVGGSTNGFRAMPTTDVVFHRWTEVFLAGLGWFPADCSRDANPIRGERSHFGRVHADVLVWCRQAGGEEDSLGWDYRAKRRVRGEDPGVRENHRTRWFEFHLEDEVEAAYAWLLTGAGARPEPDLLECALLRWHQATVDDRVRIVEALAEAGRNACLRQAAALPAEEGLRETVVRELCDSPELAEALLARSRELYRLRSWFRSNEPRLVPVGGGRFKLQERAARRPIPTVSATASTVWTDLAAEVVTQLGEAGDIPSGATVAVMAVVDQTLEGLDGFGPSIHATLERLLGRELGVRLLDEDRFDRYMDEQGPGRGEYWALAQGDRRAQSAAELVPQFVLLPVCITERSSGAAGTTLHHLEIKGLELANSKYTKAVARAHREAPARPRPGLDVLVAGGDTVLARWEHDIVSRNGFDWPLAGIEAVLAAADAALCNLECCVSLRGRPAEKGERCPFYYRARPEMLRCLTRAGIDIVTAANNHGGDYGPVSVSDTALWCARAGLVVVGIGDDDEAAEMPRLVRVGSTRVGFAGMDTTMRHFRARPDRPGTSYADEGDDLEEFTAKVGRLGRWAEGRCDLLVLTIHWGRNWVRDTPSVHREMARIAFAHGVDLILGHSAHRLQGIEVVDGKVVVYDMGNLLFDCDLRPEGKQSALFRMHLCGDGVHRVEIIPTLALDGRTVLAGDEEARQILAEMQALCTPLGTSLLIEEDDGGRAIGVIDVAGARATPRARPDPDLAGVTLPAVGGQEIEPEVPAAAVAQTIPAAAHRVLPPAELAPGVELLAYRLPDTVSEGGILEITTWWRVTGRVDRNVMPAFLLSTGGETARRGTPWYTRHDAADWTVPLALLTPGQIVEDHYPARLAGLPAGTCAVHAVVIETTRPEPQRWLAEPHLLGAVEIRPRVDKLKR